MSKKEAPWGSSEVSLPSALDQLLVLSLPEIGAQARVPEKVAQKEHWQQFINPQDIKDYVPEIDIFCRMYQIDKDAIWALRPEQQILVQKLLKNRNKHRGALLIIQDPEGFHAKYRDLELCAIADLIREKNSTQTRKKVLSEFDKLVLANQKPSTLDDFELSEAEKKQLPLMIKAASDWSSGWHQHYWERLDALCNSGRER